MKYHEYTNIPNAPEELPWNTESEWLTKVFCAALQGIIARGAEPGEAISFSNSVVLRIMTYKAPHG